VTRRYQTTDLSLGVAEAIELRADGTAWLTGSVVAEVSRAWGAWHLHQVRALGWKYPGRYATVRTTGAERTLVAAPPTVPCLVAARRRNAARVARRVPRRR
jgi:hypothetical protein